MSEIPQQAPVQNVTVKQRRGCSVCGCGCIIPTFVVPASMIAFRTFTGLAVAATAALVVGVFSMQVALHAPRLIRRGHGGGGWPRRARGHGGGDWP